MTWLRRHLAALEIMAECPPTPCTIEEARAMECFDSEEEMLEFVAYSEAEDYDAIAADTEAGIAALRWALAAAEEAT